MGAEEGVKKILAAKKAASVAGEGPGANIDSDLQAKWHDRSYNPINDAKRGTVSEAINADAGKYRKGPGPL